MQKIGKGTVDVEGHKADEHLYVTSCFTSGRCHLFICLLEPNFAGGLGLVLLENVHQSMFMRASQLPLASALGIV